ncbi:hypothetical protein K435DRAFT_881665, partial [Dendrothele bispora CBS 962.96]
MSTLCKGCNKFFAGGFFQQHIDKTSSRACRAYGNQIGQSISPDRSAVLDQLLQGLSGRATLQESGPVPVEADGDYFGQYNDMDVNIDITNSSEALLRPTVNNNAQLDSDLDSDSDSSVVYEELEDHWEPEPATEDDIDTRSPSPEMD